MRKRTTTCAAIVVAASLGSGKARAESIERGTFALGGERLMGMFHADQKIGNAPSAGATSIGLLGNGADIRSAPGAFELPRIGLDGFIIDGLSLGGSLIVWHTASDGYSQTSFLIEPRIGFAYMFGRVVGIWPRGGVGYWHTSTSPDNGPGDNSSHCFAFNVDVPLVIRPVPHFAITVGPVLDVGFAGKRSAAPAPDQDLSFTAFGLAMGMVAFL